MLEETIPVYRAGTNTYLDIGETYAVIPDSGKITFSNILPKEAVKSRPEDDNHGKTPTGTRDIIVALRLILSTQKNLR